MIKIDAVSKTYQTDHVETQALADINLHIREGEFVAIMGPSGCGKSTLLNLMGLLDQPSTGRISIQGKPVESYRDRDVAQLRNEHFGFIFQSFHLINDLRVIDNVELPLLYGAPGRKLSSSERRARAERALQRVGLSARALHYPNQLSGGQQQRVAIARAIVGDPKVVFADEPTGNLDSQRGEEVMSILQQLNHEGSTIVMVTHDEEEAARAHRLLRIFDGQLVH